MAETFDTICEKKMCITTFKIVFGMLNSFPPLFCYFEILRVHRSKMTVLENIVRKRCVTPLVFSDIIFKFEVLFVHKSNMAATAIL